MQCCRIMLILLLKNYIKSRSPFFFLDEKEPIPKLRDKTTFSLMELISLSKKAAQANAWNALSHSGISEPAGPAYNAQRIFEKQ